MCNHGARDYHFTLVFYSINGSFVDTDVRTVLFRNPQRRPFCLARSLSVGGSRRLPERAARVEAERAVRVEAGGDTPKKNIPTRAEVREAMRAERQAREREKRAREAEKETEEAERKDPSPAPLPVVVAIGQNQAPSSEEETVPTLSFGRLAPGLGVAQTPQNPGLASWW